MKRFICIIILIGLVGFTSFLFAEEQSTLLSPAPVEQAVPAQLMLPKIDTGDTAWMIVATAFVMLMTPGLALFYGGMVRGKNVRGTIMQSFVAIAIVSIQWILFGYSIAFGPDVRGIIASSEKQ